MWCFAHFDLEMCFSPQRRAIFPDRNSKNGSEHEVFCAFWLTNVLRATAACHSSGSQLQKWLRAWGVLYILTYKCASRHSGVPFFQIATPKMAPSMRCFVHFDLQMCFAPQRRAIFPDRNFKNGSEHEVFCAFWLTNVLRAKTACHFCRPALAKCVRRSGVLYILTGKWTSRHGGVQFFVSQLNSYLRTRRFSEATFVTSGSTNHRKNTAIRDFPNISRTCTFCLVTLLACWSSFYWLDCCATLLFNSPYCRKLDFETSFDYDYVWIFLISCSL